MVCTQVLTTIEIWLFLLPSIVCHIADHVPTPSNRVEHFCNLADTCVHDTIPVCGKMGDETRTFLDICDMLEYACDTTQIYTHIEDIDGCPVDNENH